jgi:hypothetical protein
MQQPIRVSCAFAGKEMIIETAIAETGLGQIEDKTVGAGMGLTQFDEFPFNDIRNIRENFYGLGFDDTYLDLIKALNLETTKGRVAAELSRVNKSLEDLFEGKIEQTGQKEQPFLFKKGNQQFAMHQTAEGIKKIGIVPFPNCLFVINVVRIPIFLMPSAVCCIANCWVPFLNKNGCSF